MPQCSVYVELSLEQTLITFLTLNKVIGTAWYHRKLRAYIICTAQYIDFDVKNSSTVGNRRH